MVVCCLDNLDFLVGIVILQRSNHSIQCGQCTMIVGIVAQTNHVVVVGISFQCLVEVDDGLIIVHLCVDNNFCLRTFLTASSYGTCEIFAKVVPCTATFTYLTSRPHHSCGNLIASLDEIGCCTIVNQCLKAFFCII